MRGGDEGAGGDGEVGVSGVEVGGGGGGGGGRTFSSASWAALKRRARCWFIFARGATPSMAMKSNFRGRTIANRRSM